MYPKKINRTLHVGKHIQREESVKTLIIDKLVQDYGRKNQLNVNLIMAYVDDFFVCYKASEGAVRALKEEIKEAILRPENEKQLMIQRLHQRISRKQKEEQLKTLTNPKVRASLPDKIELQNKTENSSQIKLGNTLPLDVLEERRKSIYKVDGSVDEWAAIIKYDTQQFQKELEEQKKLLLLNQQKIKEELDRQVAEKESRKQKEKKEEQNYYATSQQQLMEFEKQQELLKESKKQQLLQEKFIRDQQVYVDKRKKKEQNLNTKQYEEEMLAKVKEELKAEDQQQKRKRLEQKEKFQQILKLNENLRKKAKEEVIQSKEHEKLLQEQSALKDQLENERKEKFKKDKEEKIKQLMNNYSEFVMKNKKDNKQLEDSQGEFWAKKNSEHSAFLDFKSNTNKKEQQLQISQDLQQQILEKKRRYTLEVSEKKQLFEQQLQEQKALKKQDEERRNNIRQMYVQNAEDLKKQMTKGYLSQSPKRKQSPNERMVGYELLQNKKLLKKIANDNSIGISITKQEISIPE
ncbi:unnamed protein product (macronuclear) [Paramecium tetraurelia]|uniref:Trichohyalin-plectin-homology domain-containing protein n=1 Tax=Paramecium tetraurelia TaxID=5888 RepID=A0DC76_PARTE|nr:uncharacterized protein GSPATT00015521001 [Paramecium tetraurelia]CAK80643.1 unnamed protein product [Paramecium tetraurelia]|eukprot:XP_001448040.1 hypothetical protein (macronuclear) [Paramecium tetraurelia strain d4-2]